MLVPKSLLSTGAAAKEGSAAANAAAAAAGGQPDFSGRATAQVACFFLAMVIKGDAAA